MPSGSPTRHTPDPTIDSYAASLKKREAMWAPPQTVVKLTNAPSPKPPVITVASSTEKSGPAAAVVSTSRPSAPSAPRAQLASSNGTSHRTNDTRLAMGRSVIITY